jgi:hypothetical protein
MAIFGRVRMKYYFLLVLEGSRWKKGRSRRSPALQVVATSIPVGVHLWLASKIDRWIDRSG